MKCERDYHIFSKRRYVAGLLLIIAAALIFVENDAFLYKNTIARVVSVDNTFSHVQDGPNEEEEKYYDQEIQAKVLNGDRKGEHIALENTYSQSGVNDERYYVGEQIFVSLRQDTDSGTINGKKRDFFLACLCGMFLVLLLILNGRKGGIIAVSVCLNVLIFLYALSWYGNGGDLIQMTYMLVLIFNGITLVFAGGVHRKTLVAIIASLATTGICYGIYEVVLLTSERLPYEMMDYVVNPSDLSELFLTGVLMGSLGAVMDVSISIAAGVSEILYRKPDISVKSLVNSVREMGYDIMGTMINVLFFTYISSAIPVLVIKIKNGYTLYHLINFQLVFELIRFLMGAIGIVLAIPVSIMCAIMTGTVSSKQASKNLNSGAIIHSFIYPLRYFINLNIM
ncbi:MAG: YibE/F family protein [Clostridiales bacterium]|nr:YibE/F family protein [Clostridiales bacterium]